MDLAPFIREERNVPLNLCSAPVMFHIEYEPSILVEIDKGLESINDVDYARVYDIVVSGPGIEQTRKLQREHSQRALEALAVFDDSDARRALSNIIAAIDFWKARSCLLLLLHQIFFLIIIIYFIPAIFTDEVSFDRCM